MNRFKVFDTKNKEFVDPIFFVLTCQGRLHKINKLSEPFTDSRYIPIYSTGLKDHEVREFVNELRDTAIKYKDAQCLRGAILRVVLKHVERDSNLELL